jgi:COMPASS component SDC1
MRNAPTPAANGEGGAGSRATSAHPDPGVHGAPARQYLNSKVTGPLLEGMKMIAMEQYVYPRPHPPCKPAGRVTRANDTVCRPKDPLRMLGEFLLQRSKELEGQS